jgi:hypothetical protein
VVLGAYFIGIMKSFQNNVKIFGAIRQSGHMNQIEEQKYEEYSIKNRKWYIIYPNDSFKSVWNIFLIVILIFTGMLTPFRVCFIEGSNNFWFSIDVIFDLLFFLDIVINFLSAYEDDEKRIIDRLDKIAIEYLFGWFMIDIVAVIPINYFLSDNIDTSNKNNFNKLLRLLRLPRIYRLLRLLKL